MKDKDMTYDIRSLGPFNEEDREDIRNLEGYPVYKGFFEKALKTDSINKIAITGNFGIGKSSFIRCFEHNTNKKFFYVSIEDFNNSSSGNASLHSESTSLEPQIVEQKLDDKPLKKNDKEEVDTKRIHIESTLLKNIVYQCDRSLLKNSGLELVRAKNANTIVKISSLYIFLLTLLITVVKFPNEYSAFIHGVFGGLFSNISFHQFHMDLYVLIAILLAVGAATITHFILTNIKLSKITLKASVGWGDGDAEIKGRTILDEYGRELIYIFEQLSECYDLFVFEDFDRVEHTIILDIMSYLYDVNMIVNTRLKRCKAKPLKFCFILNDLVISKMLATKYFDYIMPVIPEIQTEMSSDYFISILHNAGKGISLPVNIINAIQLISDYRTINEIFNEYNVLHSLEEQKNNTLNESEMISMLSFTIYKVVYPEDYYKIRDGKSSVFPKYELAESNVDPFVFNIIELIKGYLNFNCFKYIGYSEKALLEWKEKQFFSVTHQSEKKKQLIIDELRLLNAKTIGFSSYDDNVSNKGKWLCIKILFRFQEDINSRDKLDALLNGIKIPYFFYTMTFLLSLNSSEDKKKYGEIAITIFSDLKENGSPIDEKVINELVIETPSIFSADYSIVDNKNIIIDGIVNLYRNGLMNYSWLLNAGINEHQLISLFDHIWGQYVDLQKDKVCTVLALDNNKELCDVLKKCSNESKFGEVLLNIRRT